MAVGELNPRPPGVYSQANVLNQSQSSYKKPVRVSTTTNLSFFYGLQTIDGVTLVEGDRVLVRFQGNYLDGIYTASTGKWARTEDFNENVDVVNGALIPVQFGTIYAGTTFQLMSGGGLVGVIAPKFQPVGNVSCVSALLTTPIKATAAGAVAIGGSSSAVSANATGIGGINIGSGYNATLGAVVIGDNLYATGTIGNYSVGVGYNSVNGNWIGARSVAIGSNTVAYQLGAIAIGSYAKTEYNGEIAFGTGGWIDGGDCKISLTPLRQLTTDATVTEISVNDGTAAAVTANRIILTNNSSYIFDIDVVARNTGSTGQTAGWNLKFAFLRDASASAVTLSTVTKTILFQPAGTSTWDITVSADTTNGRPNISVTGQVGTTIRWVGSARVVKVSN